MGKSMLCKFSTLASYVSDTCKQISQLDHKNVQPIQANSALIVTSESSSEG